MSEIKSPWSNPPVPEDVGLDGDLITTRGTDPLIDTGGESGLTQVLWPNQPVKATPAEETENSVSGLPRTPNRFEPNEQPPGIPSIDRPTPGTIDKP